MIKDIVKDLKEVRKEVSHDSGVFGIKYNQDKSNLDLQNKVICLDGAIDAIDKAIRYLERI